MGIHGWLFNYVNLRTRFIVEFKLNFFFAYFILNVIIKLEFITLGGFNMNEFMKLAIEEAKMGIEHNEGGPFGCVIVKDGKIIGKGHNEVVKNQDPTCHGEMMAIHMACKTVGSFDLTGATLYTTGEPCPMCMGAILWANISKVYYGCTIEDTEKIGFRDKKFYDMTEDERNKMFVKLDQNECLKLYDHYLNLKDKTAY